MKSTALVLAIAAATLGLGSLARAQESGGLNADDPYVKQQLRRQGYPVAETGRWEDRREEERRAVEQRAQDWRAQVERDEQRRMGQRGYDQRGYDQRGNDQRRYGNQNPRFAPGGYLPQEYRGRQYVVNDWSNRRYAQPPRGQQYVQVGSEVMLTVISTGQIASVFLAN